MRGSLINPFLAELCRLDRTADAPTAVRRDRDFLEPVLDASGAGDGRRELAPMMLPCQVEISAFGALNELANGNSPRASVVLVFHFLDLEGLGLVHPTTGEALIGVGDRLAALRDLRSGEVIQAIQTPPGLYVVEAQPEFGLGRHRNLLLTTFRERAVGVRGAGG